MSRMITARVHLMGLAALLVGVSVSTVTAQAVRETDHRLAPEGTAPMEASTAAGMYRITLTNGAAAPVAAGMLIERKGRNLEGLILAPPSFVLLTALQVRPDSITAKVGTSHGQGDLRLSVATDGAVHGTLTVAREVWLVSGGRTE